MLSRAKVYSRLNKFAYKHLESAFTRARSLSHDTVGLVHLIDSIVNSNDDFFYIAHYFAMSLDLINRDIAAHLKALPSASGKQMDFSHHIDLAVERAWIYGSLLFSSYSIRTGHIILGILYEDSLRRQLYHISSQFKDINAEHLQNDFASIVGNSPEQGAQSVDRYGLNQATISSVFISYRRLDRHIVGRIYDRLSAKLGSEKVFRDLISIPSGARDYTTILRKNLINSSVCLVVIGPSWCSLPDDRGHPKLWSEDDHVRTEVKLALEGEGIVVPVLVDEAKMPTERELPESLQPLCKCQSAPLRDDPDFESDVRRLIEHIQRNLNS